MLRLSLPSVGCLLRNFASNLAYNESFSLPSNKLNCFRKRHKFKTWKFLEWNAQRVVSPTTVGASLLNHRRHHPRLQFTMQNEDDPLNNFFVIIESLEQTTLIFKRTFDQDSFVQTPKHQKFRLNSDLNTKWAGKGRKDLSDLEKFWLIFSSLSLKHVKPPPTCSMLHSFFDVSPALANNFHPRCVYLHNKQSVWWQK